MATAPIPTNIGGYVSTVYANGSNTTGAPVLIVAAAGTDNVERTGTAIDRMTYGMPQSAVLSFKGLFTLGAAETCAVTAKIQDSADNSTWSASTTLYTAAVAGTGPGGGGNVECTKDYDLNLSGYKRYVRFLVTVNLSASGTDTGFYACNLIMGGQANLPV